MSNLLRAGSLIRPSKPTSPSFELAAPNPILGKTVFLRLPITAGWNFEVSANDLRSERNLILRDQMWVTRGEARFAAVHKNGVRVEVAVRIRAWKSGARRESSTEQAIQQARGKRPDERHSSRSLLGRLSAGRRPEARLTIRCHHTERQIEIRWTRGVSTDFEGLLDKFQCH